MNLVGKCFWQKKRKSIDFAAIVVKQHGEGKAGLMMKTEHVNAAGQGSAQINMEKPDVVPERVRKNSGTGTRFVAVQKVSPIGKQPVYNMEVQDHHNFLVQGGLVVHNCIDAVRYGLENDMLLAMPPIFGRHKLY